MEEGTPLAGSCSCGRNHFIIYTPPDPLRSLRLLYDEQVEQGRALSLRVPVTRFHSVTRALYDDETHNSIRRVFTPRRSPHVKRHFCGFCGTRISHWSEQPPEEAEYLFVNIGSLEDESVEKLEDAGVFSEAGEVEVRPSTDGQTTPHEMAVPTRGQSREVRGNPWFEEMIQGSTLGRIKRRRGGETSADGKTTVEWEVVELGDDNGDLEGAPAPKRKIDNLNDDDGSSMKVD